MLARNVAGGGVERFFGRVQHFRRCVRIAQFHRRNTIQRSAQVRDMRSDKAQLVHAPNR
jgi:hypothetical protein